MNSKKIEPKLSQKYLGLKTIKGRSCSDENQIPSLNIKESAAYSALNKIFDKSRSPKQTNKPNVFLSPNFLKSIALTPIDRKRF